MEGSAAVEDLVAPPDSWEVADLDASMRRLMLKDSNSSSSSSSTTTANTAFNNQSELANLAPASSISRSSSGVSEDAINSVDQFLREAIQNPRERLSVLRIEQDIEKFIRDPTRQQMEFQQLPTSYLRLAAHRVAQHYSLQSMVLMDNSIPDGSGSKIIVCKTAECRIPAVRLADIPLNLPTDGNSVVKVAIKQRPQKGLQNVNSSNSQSMKTNSSKSVEERKEEYNRARARIFNSNSSGGGVNGKPEGESRTQDSFQHGSPGVAKIEEKLIQGGASDVNIGRASDVNIGRASDVNIGRASDVNIGRGVVDPSIGSSRSARSRAEKDPAGRSKTNNRVAIFRDRETERKDPDYDRSYERYMQRFDPGFGFNSRPYIIQPMYAPALNYNTEFPQLGSVHRPPGSTNHQPRPLPQHLPRPWVAPSTPAGIGYGPPEAMITPYSPNHVGGRSNSALYMHSPQYSCQLPGMPFIHPHEQVQHPFSQTHQQQPDASFGLARPQ